MLRRLKWSSALAEWLSSGQRKEFIVRVAHALFYDVLAISEELWSPLIEGILASKSSVRLTQLICAPI